MSALTFKHDGLRLAYDVVGEGFPVILHTGAGGDSRMWRDAGYVDALGGYTVVLFDHRGHGASDAPTDPRGYLPEHHAADVVALADHLGLGRFAFWGYSAGARFGFQLAATRPDRVAGLIALGTVDAEDADPAEWLTDAESARVKGLEPILEDEGCAQAAAAIARGRAVILPELGHIDAFVQSQRVLQHALPFLNEVRTRASS